MAPLVSMLVSVVLVSAIGAGAGWGASLVLAPPSPAVEEPVEPVPAASPVAVTALPPILVNLAHPSGTWVRAELSLLSDAHLPAGEAEAVAQDLLAYLRTLRLDQVEGPSGFLTMREELDERAGLRTEGRARRVLIRTLLFE